jgi:hypothetical protein
MLLSKALDLTDTVTGTVTSHLPGPLATPVQLAVSTLTWVPRRVLGGAEQVADHGRAAAGKAAENVADQVDEVADQVDEVADTEPEVVLTLDRPAEELPPPIDVVGDALRAEAAEVPPAHQDEEHVEVAQEVVYSSGPDTGR